MLWFDVEKRYKAMWDLLTKKRIQLWFDVEKRYKAISNGVSFGVISCGLM